MLARHYGVKCDTAGPDMRVYVYVSTHIHM